MTRKLMLTLSAIALTLVVGALVTGVTMAQQGKFTHIQAQKDGDNRVVAVVEGQDLTWGEVRITKERRKAIDPTLTDDQSKADTLYSQVQRLFLQAKVESANLEPTDAEVRAFMEPHKTACMASGNSACQDFIREQGYSNAEDFWTNAFANYKADLGEIKLVKANVEAQGLKGDEVTPAQFKGKKDEYIDGLQKNADIVWHDEALKRLYLLEVKERQNR